MLPPILANYYITYRCNARCNFCDIWRTKEYREVGDARLGDVLDNLKSFKRIGLRFVDFTGGEPLLHPHLPQMLEHAKHLGLRTSVTTNCVLYPNRASEISGLVDFLHFSLDSADARVHDRLRGIRCFKNVMRSLETAENIGQVPDLLFTVTQRNWQEIESMVALAQSRRLELIINPVFSHNNNNLSEVILQHLECFASEPYVYVNKGFHRLRRRNGNNILAPRCRAVSSTVVISPDNKMLLPCFHHAVTAIPIKGNLDKLRADTVTKFYRNLQGRFDFCSGCTINCYFDPSFHYKLDAYFLDSIKAKAKYWFDKHVRRPMEKSTIQIKKQFPTRALCFFVKRQIFFTSFQQ